MNMKKLFTLLSSAALFMTACTGSHDPEVEDTPAVAPFTLSVDKAQIESNGIDAAVFTITDANGKVLTDASHIRNTSFYIVETGEWRTDIGSGDAPNVFTSITDGTYTGKAMYEGEYCENEVQVQSSNRKAYELFHKNVLIYRFTATWCQYCPSMTEALSKINDFSKDHSLVMEFHGSDQYTFDAIKDYAAGIYSTVGYPYCDYSLVFGSGKRTLNDLHKNIKSVLVDYPAQTGIKAETKVENGNLVVNAAVTASVSGEYDLAMAIVMDGCRPSAPADGSAVYEEEYDNVIVGITGNYKGMSSDRFTLEKNVEKTLVKEISGFSSDPERCRVILFTMRNTSEGKTIVDNAVSVPVGQSVEYRYN
jgi:thiol-disulfide isomerase/thioredoxin